MTSLIEVYRRFPTREAAVAHLVAVRWPHGPICPNCGATTVSAKAEANQADRLQCWSCQRSFSATVGTIFHNSHIDLQRWYLLIALMLSAKKGLSAMQAARDLDMRRPTVWSMMNRVRRALADDWKLRGLSRLEAAPQEPAGRRRTGAAPAGRRPRRLLSVPLNAAAGSRPASWKNRSPRVHATQKRKKTPRPEPGRAERNWPEMLFRGRREQILQAIGGAAAVAASLDRLRREIGGGAVGQRAAGPLRLARAGRPQIIGNRRLDFLDLHRRRRVGATRQECGRQED